MKLATLCYLKRQGQTLMLLRNKKPNDIHEGKWNGLGGKFERGESPEECVRREVLEESGLIIDKPVLCGLLTFPNFKDDQDWYVYVFTAENPEGELINSAEGHLEWIDDERLLELNLWEGDHHFLRWIAQGKFFSAKFEYVDKTLQAQQVEFHDYLGR